MTDVEMRVIPGRCALTAKGHAEDSRVCAVISSLFQFAAAYLRSRDQPLFERRLEPGDSSLVFQIGKASAFLPGYLSLAFGLLDRDYPDDVRFSERSGVEESFPITVGKDI